MVSGWRYRTLSTAGVVICTVVAVLVSNHPATQAVVTEYVPVLAQLSVMVLSGEELLMAVGLSTVVVFSCFVPLYKPRPQRILDTMFLTEKRVLVATFALATLGYFNWSARLPRATLAVAMGLLSVWLPTWFAVIRRRPMPGDGRTIIVGDDPEGIERATRAIGMPVLGYLSPPIIVRADRQPAVTDGGTLEVWSGDLPWLGGLSRLNRILVDNDITTVVLAFSDTDRGEFFGVLETCHTHGVEAKVLREHADSVLLSDETAGELATVDLEPWDWQDRLFKRAFDVAFALSGIVAFAPVLGVIALAIRLDSPGPVFYSQKRTAGLGGTFEARKFRTMVPDSEVVGPVDDENNDRITRIGRLLRKSNLDELPQLWSILTGDMSVVGPRAVWTDEEAMLERQAIEWRKRWFVKPGLTGLAQVHDVSSTDPETKLRYDLEYIRKQSFWFDLKLVIRQVWLAMEDVYVLVIDNSSEELNSRTNQ